MAEVSHRIPPLRYPDEVRYVMLSISANWPKFATWKDGETTLSGLSKKQHLALDLFHIFSEADQLIDNLNTVIADLRRLQHSPTAFSKRYDQKVCK